MGTFRHRGILLEEGTAHMIARKKIVDEVIPEPIGGDVSAESAFVGMAKVATDACPPCFENIGTVYRFEMLDEDMVPPMVVQSVVFAMDDGVPVRIRLDDPIAPTWYEHLDAESFID